MNENNLAVKIYSSGTTEILDIDGSLALAEIRSYETMCPGGLFGAADIFCPRDVTKFWLVKETYRIVIKNGLTTVYEGEIVSLEDVIEAESQGTLLRCAGYWGTVLNRHYWDKRWADQRIGDEAWKIPDSTADNLYVPDKFTTDKYNRIQFTPKGIAIGSAEYIYAVYTMPNGETCKNASFNYDMQEGAQNWTLGFYCVTGDDDKKTINTSGTGAATDIGPFIPPSQSVWIYFRSGTAQTPIEDGTYYGKVTSVVVYSELSSINLTEIAKDCRAEVTELSADESLIGSNSFSLVPFITEGPESIASILIRAASFGGTSFEQWAVGVRESDLANTADGKPILFAEAYPALTDYDYAIRLNEENLEPPMTIVRDTTNLTNYIWVRYRDELNNADVIISPEMAASLKDTTSIADYKQREYVYDSGQATDEMAKQPARRYLAAYKDPKYSVSGPITVKGYIRGKAGNIIPACQIRAGKRIKIENYITDLVGVSGAGLTFIITQTSYSDETETCSISCGVPDDLAVYLAQRELVRGI